MKISGIAEFKKKSTVLIAVILLAGSLAAGCASHSHSYNKNTTTDASGQTVVVEKEASSTTEDSHGPGILGGTFDLLGEILAFPFEVIAGAFRFIF